MRPLYDSTQACLSPRQLYQSLTNLTWIWTSVAIVISSGLSLIHSVKVTEYSCHFKVICLNVIFLMRLLLAHSTPLATTVLQGQTWNVIKSNIFLNIELNKHLFCSYFIAVQCLNNVQQRVPYNQGQVSKSRSWWCRSISGKNTKLKWFGAQGNICSPQWNWWSSVWRPAACLQEQRHTSTLSRWCTP